MPFERKYYLFVKIYLSCNKCAYTYTYKNDEYFIIKYNIYFIPQKRKLSKYVIFIVNFESN